MCVRKNVSSLKSALVLLLSGFGKYLLYPYPKTITPSRLARSYEDTDFRKVAKNQSKRYNTILFLNSFLVVALRRFRSIQNVIFFIHMFLVGEEHTRTTADINVCQVTEDLRERYYPRKDSATVPQ